MRPAARLSPKIGFVPPGDKRLGFDHFIGFNRGHRYLKSVYFKDTEQPYHCPRFEPDYQTDHLLGFLRSCHNQGDRCPFLAMISFGTPHFPNDMPDDLRSMYSPRNIALPPETPDPERQIATQRWKLEFDQDGDENGLNWSKTAGGRKGLFEPETEQEIRQFVTEYYALISTIDHNVGRILHYLDGAGIASNTIVIFLSDHGDMLGQKGHYCGIKRSPYRESTKVPFLVRYPDRLATGRVVASLFDASIDTMPTLLALAEIEIPSAVQGINQLSVLEGAETALRSQDFYELPSQTGGGELADYMHIPERGIRTRKWMYCRKPDRHKYLFDLEADPMETRNLIDDPTCASTMMALNARIDVHMWETGDDWSLCVRYPYPDQVHHPDINDYLDNVVLPSAIVESGLHG